MYVYIYIYVCVCVCVCVCVLKALVVQWLSPYEMDMVTRVQFLNEAVYI